MSTSTRSSRRQFLHQLAGLSTTGGLASLGAGASMMALPQVAHAQSDYRALVCLFLFGGNDGLNTIVPMDDSVANAGYSRYSTVRGALALPRGSGANALVPLSGSRFGLHPSLAPLSSVWDDNGMAIVHNVGPLARPMTQAQYVQWRELQDSTFVPEGLFSHSDQQRQWENARSITNSTTGWGGLAAEQLDSRQVVSFAGNTRFGGGARNNELVLPEPGGSFGLNGYWNGAQPNARRAALMSLMNENPGHLTHNALANQQRMGIELSGRLETTLKLRPGEAGSNSTLNTAFGQLAAPYNTRLSRQLYQVAKMVEGTGRAALGGTRHIFFVSLGGFDTHAGQLTTHANLLADMGRSVAAFYNALKALGLSDKVTLFTASDFGRSFKTNSSAGTDHAWGNSHIVIGNGVNAKAMVGQYPELTLGGPNDAADPTKPWEFQGRWIPGTGLTQYSGALLRWLSPSIDLTSVLPGLNAFGGVNGANIGLMRS
jgi:uncharacterized protein (DUF1501 family)